MSSHLTPDELELAAAATESPAHLAECAECKGHVARARARQALLKGMSPYTLSDDAFRRSEAQVLSRAREAKSASGWRLWLPLGLGVAAAAAFFLTRPAPVVVAPPIAVAPVVHTWPALTVALGSSAERKVEGAWQPLQAGAVLTAATELRAARVVLVGAGVVLDGAPVQVLGPQALAELEAEGRLDVDGRGAEVISRCAARWFKSTDAAYTVTRSAAWVDLEVRRGEVWAADGATFARAVRVAAPAHVRWADGAAASETRAEPSGDGPAYRPADGVSVKASGLLVLQPTLPHGDRVSLDDATLGGAPLSMLLPPGRHHLRFFQGDKLVGDRWVVSQAGEVAVLEEPRAAAPKSPPLARVSDADQQRLLGIAINAQKGKFSGCYEKWLKNDANAGGGFKVAITVSERGKVKSATVTGTKVPAEVASCVERTAHTFKFPVLGDEVEVEVPVQMVRP